MEKINLATPELEVHLLTMAQQMGHMNCTENNKKTPHRESTWVQNHILPCALLSSCKWNLAFLNQHGQVWNWTFLPQSPIVIGQSATEARRHQNALSGVSHLKCAFPEIDALDMHNEESNPEQSLDLKIFSTPTSLYGIKSFTRTWIRSVMQGSKPTQRAEVTSIPELCFQMDFKLPV